jgi:hypothetical protein
MLGDTSKVLKAFQNAGYEVIQAEVEVECEGPENKSTNGKKKTKKTFETCWRILARDKTCVGVVTPTPAPKRILGRMVCFGEPWFHTEPDAVALESGHDAVYAAEKILNGVGRGGVFHKGKVWHAGNGGSVSRILS